MPMFSSRSLIVSGLTFRSFGLCGRGRGWDDLGEWHRNMYNIICETNRQSRFDAGIRMLRAGALEWRFFLK